MPTPRISRITRRIVPMYHFGVFVPFLRQLHLGGVSTSPHVQWRDIVIAFLVSIALLLMFFSLRVQVLTVQDRVIRLEMRLRLLQALPPDLQAHIAS